MFEKEIVYYKLDNIDLKKIALDVNKKPMFKVKLFINRIYNLTNSEKEINSVNFIITKFLQILKTYKIINNNWIMYDKININRVKDPLYKYREYNVYYFNIMLLSKNNKILEFYLEYDTFYKELYKISCIFYNQNDKEIKKVKSVLNNFLLSFNKNYEKYVFGVQDLKIYYY